MRRAGQTPHGARPNREGVQRKLDACRLGAPQPPGRSLEPRSNAWPRGMTVLPQGRQNSAYRSGCDKNHWGGDPWQLFRNGSTSSNDRSSPELRHITRRVKRSKRCIAQRPSSRLRESKAVRSKSAIAPRALSCSIKIMSRYLRPIYFFKAHWLSVSSGDTGDHTAIWSWRL
jgi:hypothetical protein